jgi:nucleotide-binding universal stress UspA family protein
MEAEMEGKSIVVGVDGSPDSDAAVRVATDLATRLARRLVLVGVVEYVVSPYAAVAMGGVVTRRTIATAELDAATADLLDTVAGTIELEDVETRVVAGHAAERLAVVADEERAELIVVGSRGRGAFKAAFLGSVSLSLVAMARCPVLVVPRSLT